MARSNTRLEVSGAGKTEHGLVQYNEEVNKLGDDLRELYETIRVNVDANYAAQIEGYCSLLGEYGKKLRLYVPCLRLILSG